MDHGFRSTWKNTVQVAASTEGIGRKQNEEEIKRS